MISEGSGMKKSGEILTRTGSIRCRRSVVFVDDEIQEFSADLLENLSKVDGFSYNHHHYNDYDYYDDNGVGGHDDDDCNHHNNQNWLSV